MSKRRGNTNSHEPKSVNLLSKYYWNIETQLSGYSLNYTNQLMWLILYAKICELDWKNIFLPLDESFAVFYSAIFQAFASYMIYIYQGSKNLYSAIYIHYTSTNVTCWWRLNIQKSVICHQILFACVRNLTQMSH